MKRTQLMSFLANIKQQLEQPFQANLSKGHPPPALLDQQLLEFSMSLGAAGSDHTPTSYSHPSHPKSSLLHRGRGDYLAWDVVSPLSTL